MKPTDQLITEVKARLGVGRLLARRAVTELHDHLDDAVADQIARGIDPREAEENATQRVGTCEDLVGAVIDTNQGVKMIAFLKRHRLATVAVLAAPGVLLLVLSFLTFNFPCRDVAYKSMGEMTTFTICGSPALQSLRPLISEVGFYGGPAWAQWMIHTLSVVGPLCASLLVVSSQVFLRRPPSREGTLEIRFALDRKQLFTLAATLGVFLAVAAYKAAG